MKIIIKSFIPRNEFDTVKNKFAYLFDLNADKIDRIIEFEFGLYKFDVWGEDDGKIYLTPNEFYVMMVYARKSDKDAFPFVVKKFDTFDEFKNFAYVIISELSYWAEVIENMKKIAQMDYDDKFKKFDEFKNELSERFKNLKIDVIS